MKQLCWVALVSFLIASFSVLADGAETDLTTTDSSIEVGFSQDGEPEPHLLAVAQGGEVRLYQLEEKSPELDRKTARAPSDPPESVTGKQMPVDTYVKRLRQAVETDRFFQAAQVRRKRGGCKDTYVLRVGAGGKFRERRGCSNQSNDPFAAFAQLVFRDGFLVWNKTK